MKFVETENTELKRSIDKEGKENNITITKVAESLRINKFAAQKHFDALTNKGIIKRIRGKRGGY